MHHSDGSEIDCEIPFRFTGIERMTVSAVIAFAHRP